MDLISDYLETYEGRDKFLRTLTYAAKFATIIPKSDADKNKFKLFGSQISNCRIILRLLDDIPIFYNAITYGWGKQESDRVIRWLELTQILVDIIYSPVETICWAGEHELITINVDKWDNTSTWFWIISLKLSFFKSLRKYLKLLKMKNKIPKSLNSTEVNMLKYQMRNETLVCTRMILDLSYAVSYLPKGTLWGGKLSTWQTGALGTLSSIIGLYQAFSKRAIRRRVPD